MSCTVLDAYWITAGTSPVRIESPCQVQYTTGINPEVWLKFAATGQYTIEVDVNTPQGAKKLKLTMDAPWVDTYQIAIPGFQPPLVGGQYQITKVTVWKGGIVDCERYF